MTKGPSSSRNCHEKSTSPRISPTAPRISFRSNRSTTFSWASTPTPKRSACGPRASKRELENVVPFYGAQRLVTLGNALYNGPLIGLAHDAHRAGSAHVQMDRQRDLRRHHGHLATQLSGPSAASIGWPPSRCAPLTLEQVHNLGGGIVKGRVRRQRFQYASPKQFQPGRAWRVPVTESTRFQSRVCLIQIQLISQATGVWVHLQAAAYSTGVR